MRWRAGRAGLSQSWLQSTPLDHGIREVRCADHDCGDRAGRGAGCIEDVLQRSRDAAGDIFGRWCFDLADDREVVHEYGVRICSADIDSDPQ